MENENLIALPEVVIREFQDGDTIPAGRLIADTYSTYNLSFATPEARARLLGPFRHAYSTAEAHQEAITKVIRSPMLYVAQGGSEIVGILRGRRERLASLFVHKDYQRRGIGRRLVERFERESMEQDVRVIRVASTLYAIPFYIKMGFKKSTGVRAGWSFEGEGLRYQPMKKILMR